MENTEEKLLKRQRIMGVIIVMLGLFSVSMFFFGLINQLNARKNLELAIRKMGELEQCEKKASLQAEIAAKNAMEAMKQQQRAEEYFKRNSKK